MEHLMTTYLTPAERGQIPTSHDIADAKKNGVELSYPNFTPMPKEWFEEPHSHKRNDRRR